MTSSREHMYDLRSLETFSFVDERGKDQGINSNFSKLINQRCLDILNF